MRRWTFACWLVGVALGSWVGRHGDVHVRQLDPLDAALGVVLLLGSALLLLAAPDSSRPRSWSRRELEAALLEYARRRREQDERDHPPQNLGG